jgi:hypothetical protein
MTTLMRLSLGGAVALVLANQSKIDTVHMLNKMLLIRDQNQTVGLEYYY